MDVFVDENQTPEGAAAFRVMRKLVSKKSLKRKRHDLGLPSCLIELMEKAKRYPCTICGKLYFKPENLVTHAFEHGPVRFVP